MNRLLTVNNLDVQYGDTHILKGVSAWIDSGSILGVVGESGSGKSTLIYAILGILSGEGKITGGSICFDGKNLLDINSEEFRQIRGKEISLIAQNPMASFHPIRKIGSQLKDLIRSHPDISYEQAQEEMITIMEKINLKDCKKILNSYAFELSGGMAQRVSIAMAMVLHPKLLLADEPTSALDVISQKQVVEEMMKIRDEYNTAILIVSHNMGVISSMADHIVVMHNGVVVEAGNKNDIVKHHLHPYTINLFNSIPDMNKPLESGIRSFPKISAEGFCPYVSVCSKKTDACQKESPKDKEIEPGHFIKCRNV